MFYKTLTQRNNMKDYMITAYNPDTKEKFTFISGKRGLDRKLELIRFEGLTDISVEEIII